MKSDIFASLSAFVAYVVVIYLLPVNGAYLSDAVMAVCAIVLGWRGPKWNWVKVALFARRGGLGSRRRSAPRHRGS